MKLRTRMWVTILLVILTSVALVLLIKYLPNINKQIYIYSYLISLISLWYFFWGGLSKLIINVAYAFLITICSFAWPKYFLGIAIAGAFLVIINPLLPLQKHLSQKLKSDNEISLPQLVFKREKVFYEYRKKMKQWFHMDAYAKLFQSKIYFLARKLFPYLLYVIATFIAIYSLNTTRHNNNVALLQQFFWINYYSYTIFLIITTSSIYIAGYIVSIKGFKSSFRFISSLFFPLATFTFAIVKDILFKHQTQLFYILIISLSLTSLIMIVIQISLYFTRVSFANYHYFSNDGKEVFANSLYEPFVFEKSYNQVGVYLLTMEKYHFLERFKKVLIYANLKKFIITAFTIKDNQITLYTVFRKKNPNKIKQFMHQLSKLYRCELITYNTFTDSDCQFYADKFYSTNEYISARVSKEANELYKLGFYKPLTLSFFFSFKNYNDLVSFSKKQTISIYQLNNQEQIIEARIIVPNDNDQILAFTKQILSDAEFFRAQYLKVLIRYEIKKRNQAHYFNNQ